MGTPGAAHLGTGARDEVVAACFGIGAALVVAAPIASPAAAIVCAATGGATPALCRIDLAEHRLPDRIVLPGCALMIAVGVVTWTAGGDGAALVAAVVAFLVFSVLTLVAGMGFGDAKLAALLAGVLAPVSSIAPVAMVVAAFIAGGIAAAVVLVRHGAGAQLAFGPWLLAGYWAALLGAA